jgi:hypothetical protein
VYQPQFEKAAAVVGESGSDDATQMQWHVGGTPDYAGTQRDRKRKKQRDRDRNKKK